MIKLRKLLSEIEDEFDLSFNPLSTMNVEHQFKKNEIEFEKENPLITINVDGKEISGRGTKYKFGTYPNVEEYLRNQTKYFFYFKKRERDLEFTAGGYYQVYSGTIKNFIEVLNQGGPKDITNNLNITWVDYYIFNKLMRRGEDQGDSFLRCNVFVKGIDNQGREYLCTSDNQTFKSPYILISGESEVEVKHSLKLEDYKIKVLNALFPSQQQKPSNDKNLNIRQVLDFSKDKVGFKFGRVIRKGPGIKGSYDELKNYLTKTSQTNLINVEDSVGVTWESMIIYRESGDTLFSVIGKDPEGQMWMWDRAGHGRGGYSKLRGPLPPDKVNLNY